MPRLWVAYPYHFQSWEFRLVTSAQTINATKSLGKDSFLFNPVSDGPPASEVTCGLLRQNPVMPAVP